MITNPKTAKRARSKRHQAPALKPAPELASAAAPAQMPTPDATAMNGPDLSEAELKNLRQPSNGPSLVSPTEEELDEDEAEFRKLRRDLPGVKGASAIGIVTVSVGKTPGKNEFFRTHADFRPVVPLVDVEVGMERQYFAVDDDMVIALAGIGISVSEHALYLTVTPVGGVRIIPINATSDNDYTRTKEIGLLAGIQQWVRLYTDTANHAYKVFPAPDGRFADPIWPELKPAKIFRLAFRDKGRLVDSVEHPLFKKWAARDRKDGK